MGRRVSTDDKSDDDDDDDVKMDTAAHRKIPSPTLRGGSLGIPDAPTAGMKTSMGGAEVVPSEQVFPPPTRKRFLVQRDVRVNLAGGVTYLRGGQFVDDQNYDIVTLREQGVQLTPEVTEA